MAYALITQNLKMNIWKLKARPGPATVSLEALASRECS